MTPAALAALAPSPDDDLVTDSPNQAYIPDHTPRVLASRPHISVSQVTMYLRCSMQWKYRYVDGLKEPPSLKLATGKAGHAALEYNTKHKIKTGADLDLATFLDVGSDLFDAHTAELERADLAEGDDPGRDKDATLETLKVFRLKAAPAIKPAASEWEFNLDIPSSTEKPLRIINGKVDLIQLDASTPQPTLRVDDYKFTAKARSQAEADTSIQLSTYDMAIEMLTGEAPSSLGLICLIPPTPKSEPRIVPIRRDAALMTPEARARRAERTRYQFETVQRGIDAGIFIPADDPKVCSWCGYRATCQYSAVR